jgi:hypothetical protein
VSVDTGGLLDLDSREDALSAWPSSASAAEDDVTCGLTRHQKADQQKQYAPD